MGLASQWSGYLNNILAGKNDMMQALSERVEDISSIPKEYSEIASAVNSIRDKNKQTLHVTKNGEYSISTEHYSTNAGYNQVDVEIQNPDGTHIETKVFNENGIYQSEDESWDPVIVDVMQFTEMEFVADNVIPSSGIFLEEKDIISDYVTPVNYILYDNIGDMIIVDEVKRI